ncbi:MAG: alkaline phosphatase D family protein, partial [Gaiellaceae bacterium]
MGVGAILVAAATTLGSPFSLGVNAGEVEPNGAVLWAHATPGPLQAEVAVDRRFHGIVFRRVTRADRAHDGTVRVRVTGLRPGTSYFYRFVRAHSASAVGRFSTAPRPTRAVNVRFAVSGDADATPAPGLSGPFYNRFGVYARMAAEGNAFNVNLGDTIYSDSEVAGTAAAVSVAAKWAKYRLNLSLPALQRLRSSTGLYSHWDDHEFINDFTRPEDGTVYAAGVRAFTDYAPVTYTSKNGLYRTFRWGRNLELFFLDERSFRSAKATAGGTCDDSPGAPDLAPTAPAGVRAAFAALIPPLTQPPPPGCVERMRDPSRTMLGERQYAQFTAAVARSPAIFKVILNEVPIQQFYALPYDRWEGYEAERQKLLRFLHDNVKNVVFLTTDTHANFVNDAR